MSLETWTVPNIQLITPMMGGGVEPMEPDSECPVRPSELRGQLRFWWRAVQDFDSKEDLLKAESALWGGMGRKSAVTVRVSDVKGYRVAPAPAGFRDLLGYVYFAARGKGVQLVQPGLTFGLKLTYPKEREQEIRRTFTLWALFGGLGARTRRGSGAVFVDLPSAGVPIQTVKNFSAWLREDVPRPTKKHPWPTLLGPGYQAKLTIVTTTKEPVKAWEQWLVKYRNFRQQRREGTGSGRPGRSYWPEPDALRTIHGHWAAQHKPAQGAETFFPRGAYGLPIVFHFKDPGEPDKYTLQVDERHDRWASPVILKVARFASGEILKLCWVLSTELPPSFYLAKGAKARRLTDAESPHAFGKGLRKGFTVAGKTAADPYGALMEWMGRKISQ